MKTLMEKISNMKNKILAALAVAFCSFATFAEGETTLPEIVVKTDAVSKLATGLKNFAESALAILLPVLGAVLVYFCVRWAWRVMKSFMNQGK